MKLRNKHTGEVEEFNEIYLTKTVKETNTATSEYVERSYYGIDELNEEWEDYKPAEPLIKDEKKLDTVKSFFALLGISNEIYYQSINKCFYKTDDDGITYGIDFDDDKGIDNICTGLPYTITELCGEEEK